MNKQIKRKNIRLAGYDYSRIGTYFITICIKDKHELLAEIHVGAGSTRPRTTLTRYGTTVEKNIEELHIKFPHISISQYVIMPNHIHCIIHVAKQVDSTAQVGRVDPAPTLGQIVGYFKYQTTKQIGISGFWQRSYHDRIIRSEDEYQKIYQYIETNPIKWAEDRYYIETQSEQLP